MYDVIVLGGGPGGYMAAEKAGHAGLKTLLIEKAKLGGTCLNEGCIPTKTLLYSAKLYSHSTAESAPYGVTCGESSIDHSKVIARKDKIVTMLTGGVGMQMKANHVEVVYGSGEILPKDGENYVVKVGEDIYSSRNLIIATGSVSAIPPLPGVKEGLASGFVKTSREILEDAPVPEKMVVIGAGVIGLEIVSYFNTIGTKVTVIEMLDKIAGPTENEISANLQRTYARRGIDFILSAKVTEVTDHSVCYEKDGVSESVPCDCVLLSVGRKANTAGFGLENLGVEMERGNIVTDECCRCNQPGLYAIGDVNGKIMLAHTAYREAECAVHDILGIEDKVEYQWIPSVIYTNPEVASIGYTAETAKEAGYENVEVVKMPMAYAGRYVAENEGGMGFAKFLFDKDKKTMIGAHILSNSSSEFLIACSILISLQVPMSAMRRLVFPHPTVAEIIREAIHASSIEE